MIRSVHARSFALLFLLAACASRQTPPTAHAPSVRRPPGRTLEVLPSGVTFTWVFPSDIFERVLPEDNEASIDGDGIELRDALTVLFAGHGWRQVPRGTGEFELTVFVQSRLRTRRVNSSTSERAPDIYLGVVCDPVTRDPRLPPCPNNRSRASEPSRETFVERMAVFGLRRADGSGLYRSMPVTGALGFASDSLSELLLRKLIAGEPRVPP